MTRFQPVGEGISSPGRYPLAWHLLAPILVLAYVHTFSIWNWMTATVGASSAAWLPLVMTAAAVSVLLLLLRRHPILRWPRFAVGACVAAVAIFLSDPDFPAKRIHVLQYMLLAIILRRALAPDLRNDPELSVMSVAIASLYGLHDEFLQGFHLQRTFGLFDAVIDALGAIAGTIMASAAGLFQTRNRTAEVQLDNVTRAVLMLIAIAAALLVLPLESYRDQTIPTWTLLPLVASAVVAATLLPSKSARLPCVRAFIAVAITLALYPLASHVPTFRFH
jgi:hypothetical protein